MTAWPAEYCQEAILPDDRLLKLSAIRTIERVESMLLLLGGNGSPQRPATLSHPSTSTTSLSATTATTCSDQGCINPKITGPQWERPGQATIRCRDPPMTPGLLGLSEAAWLAVQTCGSCCALVVTLLLHTITCSLQPHSLIGLPQADRISCCRSSFM